MSPSSFLTALCLVALTALSTACGGGGDYTIDDAALSGTVAGQPWTFAAGETSFFLSEGEDDFFATLHADPFVGCEETPPAGDHLIVAVPKEPGEYDFGLSQNMTFAVGDSENLIATDGVIRVDEVTATTVRGGLYGYFDDDNEVSGTFELSICPDETF